VGTTDHCGIQIADGEGVKGVGRVAARKGQGANPQIARWRRNKGVHGAAYPDRDHVAHARVFAQAHGLRVVAAAA